MRAGRAETGLTGRTSHRAQRTPRLTGVHLRKLEAAGLVSATIEVSEDGKAMKYYEVAPFALHLTPITIMTAARSLRADPDLPAEVR
jgi:hypothetical protein